MTALRIIADRISQSKGKAAGALAVSLSVVLAATILPAGLATADGGGSEALAELAGRSPGVRIGGVALKAKTRRVALAPVEGKAAPGAALPAPALATVLGSAAGPEGAIPTYGPLGAGGFPNDFTSVPPVDTLGAAPGGIGTIPAIGSGPILIGGGVPGGSGGPAPGGGGGGPGAIGGGGGGMPTPTPTTTPIPPVTSVTPVPSVPEPGTWIMLIVGFGFVGAGMRRGRRAAFI